MATTTPRTPEETQAISRLRALGQGVRVYCLDRDQMYCVPASAGDGSAYQVQISGEITICSCPAGSNDKYCKHVAAVEMYRVASACAVVVFPTPPLLFATVIILGIEASSP